MANASGLRGRFEDYALLWGLIGVVARLVGAAARAPPAGRRRCRAARCPATRFAACCGAARPGRRRDTASSRHSAGPRSRWCSGASWRSPCPLTDIRGRNAFVFCYVMPLMLAPQVVALAWLQMFGPSSPFLKLLGVAPALGSRNPLYSPGGHHSGAGRPIRAARIPHPARRSAHAAAGAARSGARRRGEAAAGDPHHRAAADDAAAPGGRRALLRLLPRQLRHPRAPRHSRATISCCRRSSTSGSPDSARRCCREVAVLSVLIGMIAIVGIVAQDVLLSRRDFRTASAAVEARAFELRRWRRPVEIVLWALAFLALVLPFTALLLTSLVPAVGVPLDAASATLENYRFVLFEHAAARRALRQQLRPVRGGGGRDRADRGAARLFPRMAPLAALARRERRDRSAVRRCRAWCWRSRRSSCS